FFFFFFFDVEIFAAMFVSFRIDSGIEGLSRCVGDEILIRDRAYTFRVFEPGGDTPGFVRNLSWTLIFPAHRVPKKPKSFSNPPLSYPSSTK
ncbi:hypothetical protein, partial [Escherichia coli]|uniref:hypothetical protein n=1 Tax=Escherichia coli TaxID=562 RepID=UPI001BAE63EC